MILPKSTSCFRFPIYIKTLIYEFLDKILLKIGTSPCFTDKVFTKQFNLVITKKISLAPMEVINGRLLVFGNIIEEIDPLKVVLKD